MCKCIDRNEIISPNQSSVESRSPKHRTREKKSTKNHIQLLLQRLRGKTINKRNSFDASDTIDAPKIPTIDYKFDRNFEMRTNTNIFHPFEEKVQVRNWRYHLTNDHF